MRYEISIKLHESIGLDLPDDNAESVREWVESNLSSPWSAFPVDRVEQTVFEVEVQPAE